MHPLLLLALTMQVRIGVEVQKDSADTARKGVSVEVGRTGARDGEREPRRVPVTSEHLRTAFASPAARDMLHRARAARMEQDSTLRSYEATTYLRISVGLAVAKLGRERVLFRHENATRVRWHRDVGAWIDVKGARTAIPADPQEEAEESDNMMADPDVTPVPWFPGQESLLSFAGTGVVQAQVNDRDIVHPLAEGAEAYYTYAAGDSVVFRLPDGRAIRLRELQVRPRESLWNVAIGSLWFDASSGQLVRAAYRLAVPMDIWALLKEEDPDEYDDIPALVRPMMSPLRAQITSVGMEYGLYQGRFWLPRVHHAEGNAQASFARASFRFQQRFSYESVNALDSLPPIVVAVPPTPPDSLTPAQRAQWRDSVRRVERQRDRAQRDSVQRGLKQQDARCDSTGHRVTTTRGRHSKLAKAMRIPCNQKLLATAPELPGSIYDDGEELFGAAELSALRKEALAMGVQPPMAIGAIRPTVRWGLEFTRFNRVEGLSTGLLVEQPLGGGYTTSLLGRIGHADLEPNVELTLARSNLSRVVRGRAYNRLVAAGDWGNPLSFGSSLSALLFGRDEGFYYRASGAELEWAREHRATWSWKMFAERQRTARADNDFSLGAPFIPNFTAATGEFAGVATRLLHTRGADPDGFRLFTDLRLEGAVRNAGSGYGRGALDLTMTQHVAGLNVALTAAGGTSVGALPPQRRWFLGGVHTVRGQYADTAMAGTAYWLGRAEFSGAMRALRPVLFGDVGWVGARDAWREVGRPVSGAGVGLSLLDGLARLDVARGIYPRNRVRVDLYLNATF